MNRALKLLPQPQQLTFTGGRAQPRPWRATHARWSPAGGASGQGALTLDPAIARAEGYRLTVAQEGVLIAGHNLAGLFYGVQTLRQLLQTQGATLPRMVLEDRPDFPARYALYASAKAGVEGLTRGLAVELGPMNIRCNAIAPGYVHAEQNFDLIRTWTDDPQAWIRAHSVNQQALEFEIEPIDCGWVVAFLLSELARAITGQVIRVDAGMTALICNKSFL